MNKVDEAAFAKAERKRQFSMTYGESYPKSYCLCGHTGDGARSEHADVIQAGHGPCTQKGCGCRRFSWRGFIPAFEALLAKVK